VFVWMVSLGVAAAVGNHTIIGWVGGEEEESNLETNESKLVQLTQSFDGDERQANSIKINIFVNPCVPASQPPASLEILQIMQAEYMNE
jgi:hypothetical protein